MVSWKGPDSPVYDVASESKKKKPGTLHRNMLLPSDYLSSESAAPASRQRRVRDRLPVRNTLSSNFSSDDNDEFPSFCYRSQVQLTEDVAEDVRNPRNTARPAEQQPETPDEDDQLAAVDDPVGERREQAEEREETQAEEWPDEHQAEEREEEQVEEAPDERQADETREETNKNIPAPAMAEETIEHNPGDLSQRNRQAPQSFTY